MAGRADLGRRTATGLIYTLVMAAGLLLALLSPWLTIGFFLLLGLIMAWELNQALAPIQPAPTRLLNGAGAVLLPVSLATLFDSSDWFTSLLLAVGAASVFLLLYALFSLVLRLIGGGPDVLVSSLVAVSAAVYLWWPLALLVPLLVVLPHGWLWLLLALLAPAACDLFAYFTGVLFGRRAVVPRLSPGKTWAGSIGGTAGTVLIVFLFLRLVLPGATVRPAAIWVPATLFAGLLLSLAAQFGDWLASAIKRRAGIKDFGQLLPGHGGVLDRLDSFLFTLPLTLVLAVIVERLS